MKWYFLALIVLGGIVIGWYARTMNSRRIAGVRLLGYEATIGAANGAANNNNDAPPEDNT